MVKKHQLKAIQLAAALQSEGGSLFITCSRPEHQRALQGLCVTNSAVQPCTA